MNRTVPAETPADPGRVDLPPPCCAAARDAQHVQPLLYTPQVGVDFTCRYLMSVRQSLLLSLRQQIRIPSLPGRGISCQRSGRMHNRVRISSSARSCSAAVDAIAVHLKCCWHGPGCPPEPIRRGRRIGWR